MPTIALVGLLAVGCGGEAGQETSTTTLPGATTTPSSMSTTSAPSTSAPTTSSSPPATTTTTLPVWAVPGVLEVLGPEEIPWGEVGAGWLLVRYLEPDPAGGDPPGAEVLLLIAADNTVYAVSSWDRGEILDWSPEGRRVLVLDDALEVIDLRDGTQSSVPVDLPVGEGYRVDARFTRPTGRDIVVRVVDWGEHVSLDCLRTDGTLFAGLADLDLSGLSGSEPEFVAFGVTWLYGPAGTEVVIAAGDGISLLTNLGVPIRQLDAPGPGCTLTRWWDEESVVAACYDPGWATSPCWYSGPGPGGRSVWRVPLDGSAATRLTPTPVCAPGSWEPEYVDALGVGEVVAAATGHCCECGGSLEFLDGGEVITWAGYAESLPSGAATESQACSPYLIAVRGDRLLVGDTVYGWDPDHGATGGFGAIFEVTGSGETLAVITPVHLGEFGGVLQVLTTDEAAQ